MQYADIAVSIKIVSQQTFTYGIPPELLPAIAVGQRVTVPFGRQKLIGTILKLRHQPPKIKGSLKSILSLADPYPFFSERDLNYLQKLADQHGATLGQILDQAAPSPAARVTKRELREPSTKPLTPSISGVGEQFGIYAPSLQRFESYLLLIRQSIEAGRASLILFPNQKRAEEFVGYLDQAGLSALLIPPTQQLTEFYTAWCEAVSGRAPIVVGTRKSIFISMPTLRLLIIDQPSEYGYKEEQYPYYYVPEVARLRSAAEAVHLVFGDIAPQLQEWRELQTGQRKRLATAPTMETEITLIDSSATKGLLPQVLLDRIEQAAADEQRIAIFYNRRGEGKFYHCLDCETAIYCPRCDSLLAVFSKDNAMVLHCGQCGYETAPPYRCPVCQNYRLGSVGLGIQSLQTRLQELFPQIKVALIDNEEHERADAQILLGTRQLINLPPTEHFAQLIVLQADQLLHSNGYRTDEEALLTLYQLKERADQFILQTAQPEHRTIRAFCQNQIDPFYAEEWRRREELGYPPAKQIIQLSYSDSDEPKATSEADQLYWLLRKESGLTETQIIPPGPIGSGKRRDKYRVQIIIKSPLTESLKKLIPTKWHIDPQPLQLH